ncbi:MAG: hypothetical protein GY699_20490 [Desulfobacteraceae bacterium]|nr:hypothetical protein [Desulfobacteraceae bacterium]
MFGYEDPQSRIQPDSIEQDNDNPDKSYPPDPPKIISLLDQGPEKIFALGPTYTMIKTFSLRFWQTPLKILEVDLKGSVKIEYNTQIFTLAPGDEKKLSLPNG